jgi:acetylornithine deacetylase/succinyl-diaminopimelate desuccinylase-like protein
MLSTGFMHLARKMIAADTVSANGTRGAAELLQGLWEHAGLEVQRQTVDEIHVNVLGGPGGDTKGPGGVLLVTHLDTVPAGPGWQTDPWTLTEKDGWLFGLGVADVKLDALCKAEAARRLQGRTCRRPFWLLGTFGEEVGLRGARHFVQSEQFVQIAPTQVLVGEPSELTIISAHKGYIVVRVTLRDTKARLVSTAGPGVEAMHFAGKAAHSSTPHLGENAILKALQYAKASGAAALSIRGGTSSNVVPASCVLEVPAPREKGDPQPADVKFTPARESEPNLWRTLATASALEELWQQNLPKDADARFDPAGTVGGLNVIETSKAGEVSFQLDGRLLPSHDPEQVIASFTEQAKAWVDRLGQGALEVRFETLRNAGGMAARPDSQLVRIVQKVLTAHGLNAKADAKPTSTEAGIFARASCDAIVFGPGRSTGNAHTANERIEMAQLAQACDLYEALLVELCSCT